MLGHWHCFAFEVVVQLLRSQLVVVKNTVLTLQCVVTLQYEFVASD